jgi:GH25 family lysozyme M1 (1,4-beta-N-acetylmuramidase)
MRWVERRWKHAFVAAALSATVLSTTVVATPAVAAPKVPGIDVSKYQGRIDWEMVSLTPIRFAIMRATLGNRYRDGRFARNAASARRNGLVVGAYHFAKPGLAPWDPRAEADHFLDVVRLRAGDVVPVLDIEETGGLNARQLKTWASAWLRHVERRTGVRAMIYSGNHFWHGSMANTAWFARHDHPLWVAHWYVRAPDVPGGRWAERGYTVWQWSAQGRIPGIRGPVDRDWMRGNLEQGTVASLAVDPTDGGVITGDRLACGGRLGFCSRLANPGDAITLRAIPAKGARLVRWTGGCAAAGEGRTCTVTTFGDVRVSAVFAQIEAAAPSAQTVPSPPGSSGTESPSSVPEPTPTPRPTTIPSLDSASTPAPPASLDPRPIRKPAPLDPDPGPDRDDGDGTRFSWSRDHDRHAIGRSYRWERRRAASISFGFRGGSVTLFTLEGKRMGKARISIDGEPAKVIDGYARRFRARVPHRFTGLGEGTHVLTISPLGRSHRRATDRRVPVDALRWGGKLHPDPRPEAASWARVEDPSGDGGYVVSDARGAQATLPFSGTSLTLLMLRGPALGQAVIRVDGRRVRTVDLYAPDRRLAAIPVVAGLAQGPHTATVVVLGTHSGASRGSWVAIDRWLVTYRQERSHEPEWVPHG